MDKFAKDKEYRSAVEKSAKSGEYRSAVEEYRAAFDGKSAAFTYFMVIFAIVLATLVAEGLREGGVIDINNFWTLVLFTFAKYVLLAGVFFLVMRQSRLGRRELFDEIQLRKKVSAKNVGLAVLIAGLSIVGFILVSSGFSELLRTWGYAATGGDIAMNSFTDYLVLVVLLAVIPAVVEELLFRGIILSGLLQFGRVTAVIASAVLFSLFHLNPDQTVFQLIWGIVLGLVVLRTGNLVYTMILHFVNNFLVLTYTYIAGDVSMLLVWDVKTIVITVGLAAVSILFIRKCLQVMERYQTVRAAESLSEETLEKRQERFLAFANLGYFIGVALAGLIWIMEFMG